MDVRLRRTWFAPDISGNTSGKYVARNGRVVARGHRLRKGIHRNLPDAWSKLLPSDAQVLKAPEDYELEEDEREFEPAAPVDKGDDDLAAADLQRAQAEHAQRIEEEAEAEHADQVKANRQANAAKARDAKAAKQKEKEDNA